jgi:transcriptional regulator
MAYGTPGLLGNPHVVLTESQRQQLETRRKMIEQARIFRELVDARANGENISIGTAIKRVNGKR